MGEYEALFKFAAKAGALEGYLYDRKPVKPLENWLSNIEKMFDRIPDNIRAEIGVELRNVLTRILTYGEDVLGDEMKTRLNSLHSKV